VEAMVGKWVALMEETTVWGSGGCQVREAGVAGAAGDDKVAVRLGEVEKAVSRVAGLGMEVMATVQRVAI